MTTFDPSHLAHRRLAAAILARACRDARSTNAHACEARSWLADEGTDLVAWLDLDMGRVRRWVDALPTLGQPGLGL